MKLGYNERAWSVDVITAINTYARRHQLAIRRAGGEHTLAQSGATSLFPDVILFGDDAASRVRHGWEMKFPDTPVDDFDTVDNARRKALRLGVNSFVVWNVDTAQLHIAQADGQFAVSKTWGPIGIARRKDVASGDVRWQSLLDEMLGDLNRYFESGALTSAPPSFLADTFFVDFLQQHVGLTSDALRKAANRSAKTEAAFKLWWASIPGGDESKALDFALLARSTLVAWINRLLFCHYLKGFRQEATAVDAIQGDIRLAEGIAVIQSITRRCNFMQIFRLEPGADALPDETWAALKQLNAFLADLAVQGIDQQSLRLALEGALAAAKRKVHGQYTTPDALAKLVVALGVENRDGPLLDPCCGTGTIVKAALAAQVQRGEPCSEALARIWASDRFQFPLQFTTMALAEPEAMGTPMHVFLADVFSLSVGQRINLANPHDGSPLVVELPRMSTIVSNLPFVRFETLVQLDPAVKARFSRATGGHMLDARSDLFAYIVLYLKQLLTDEGRICVVVSNAWLGTDWGAHLRTRLTAEFHIEAVVTSGAGRWFSNADVVTTVLVLGPCSPEGGSRATRFITTRKPLDEWNAEYIERIAANVHGRLDSVDAPGDYCIRSYDADALQVADRELIAWTGLFGDLSWLGDVARMLVPARSLMEIGRGERRGWDALFYPEPDHGIEPDYIRPVLLSGRGIRRLNVDADDEAFCCSVSSAELERRGHRGALQWITRFEAQKNRKGERLTEVLATGGRRWYEMRADTTADFAIAMNPEDFIFTMRMRKRSFVNQRLIRLTTTDGADIALLHALLNSSLTMFFVEASGFGRGLGALDIQPTKLKAGLKLPDPARIDASARAAILKAFVPLSKRDVLRLDEEMTSADRHAFDAAVLGSIGMAHHAPAVRSALRELYRIRKAAKA